MRLSAARAWGAAFAIVVAAVSCGDDPPAAPPPPAPADAATDGPIDRPDAGADAGPARAPFGLDTRPANPTCVAPARPPSAAPVKLERVFAGVSLSGPVAMVQPPGDPSRWFVAQRDGRVLTFPVAAPPASPAVAADLAAMTGREVYVGAEGGLLGLAFHPRFAQNGRLYVHWTAYDAPDFVSEIGELTTSDGGATFPAYRTILRFVRSSPLHLGGGLAFGRDGTLFASFGDGSDVGDDSLKNGQSLTGFASKVIRIDVDRPSGGKAYGIPADNPFATVPGQEEVYARGFRNPFRLTVDRATGEVWVGDVGENSFEEIDRVERGGNYGWPCREGARDYLAQDATKCPSALGLTDPVHEIAHVPANSRAVIGGYVYRGSKLAGFAGTYVYADYIQQEVWSLAFDGPGAPRATLLNPAGPNGAFGGIAEDDAGELYVLGTLTNDVYAIVPAAAPAPSTFPARLSETGCVDRAAPTRFSAGVLPYDVRAPFYSDDADKRRGLALPDGAKITVGADGDLDLPNGSVTIKTFERAGRPIETRLFVRHADGEWAGYSYAWLADGSDALLLEGSARRDAGGGPWHFPSRAECLRCHTAAAGRTLGLELAQLNGDMVYTSTNRVSNQLATFEHIGLFAAPLPASPDALPRLPDPYGAEPVAVRARAYLHASCAGCHRPSGGAGRATIDLRATTPLASTSACDVTSSFDAAGAARKIVAPGSAGTSLLVDRLSRRDARGMPPLGSLRVDARGVALVGAWVDGLAGCAGP